MDGLGQNDRTIPKWYVPAHERLLEKSAAGSTSIAVRRATKCQHKKCEILDEIAYEARRARTPAPLHQPSWLLYTPEHSPTFSPNYENRILDGEDVNCSPTMNMVESRGRSIFLWDEQPYVRRCTLYSDETLLPQRATGQPSAYPRYAPPPRRTLPWKRCRLPG